MIQQGVSPWAIGGPCWFGGGGRHLACSASTGPSASRPSSRHGVAIPRSHVHRCLGLGSLGERPNASFWRPWAGLGVARRPNRLVGAAHGRQRHGSSSSGRRRHWNHRCAAYGPGLRHGETPGHLRASLGDHLFPAAVSADGRAIVLANPVWPNAEDRAWPLGVGVFTQPGQIFQPGALIDAGGTPAINYVQVVRPHGDCLWERALTN